jgi:hypothetical protein
MWVHGCGLFRISTEPEFSEFIASRPALVALLLQVAFARWLYAHELLMQRVEDLRLFQDLLFALQQFLVLVAEFNP